MILLEFLPGGDLLSWLRRHRAGKGADVTKEEVTSSMLLSFALQIARAMAHLEQEKVIPVTCLCICLSTEINQLINCILDSVHPSVTCPRIPQGKNVVKCTIT